MGALLHGGALTDDARGTVKAIADELARDPARCPPGERLVVWQAVSTLLDPRPGAEPWQEAFDAACEALDSEHASVGVQGGLAGIGWAVHDALEPPADDLAPVDAVLADAIAATDRLDRAGGLAGIGTYLLERPAATAAAGIAAIVDVLEARAVDGRWIAAPGAAAGPQMFVGDAGIVELLAAIARGPHGSARGRALVAAGAEALATSGATDPGSGAALWIAGSALGEPRLQSIGLERVVEAGEAAVDRCRSGIVGLAGGAAWVTRLYDAFWRATGDRYLGGIARACVAELIPRVALDDLGVWTGAGGVALAIAAALSDEVHGWDRLIGLAIAPAPAGVARQPRVPARDPRRTSVDGLTSQDLVTTRAGWWDATFTRWLLAAIPERVDRLVDLGCGLAHVGRSVLPAREGARYLGVDIDAERLAGATRALASAGLADRAAVVRARIEALPLAGASVDVVTGTLVLQHVADPAAVLAEVRRVLRPGGTLTVVEPDHLAIAIELDGVLADLDRAFVALGARSRDEHIAGDLSIGPRLPELVRAAGFTDVDTASWPCPLHDQRHTAAQFARHLRAGVVNLARRARLALTAPACAAAFAAIDDLVMSRPSRDVGRARRTMRFHRCRATRP
jgi:SAM-dependent methyltransferase